jgi:hypothetical protein
VPEFLTEEGLGEDISNHVVSADVCENGVAVLEVLIYAEVFTIDEFAAATEVDRLL